MCVRLWMCVLVKGPAACVWNVCGSRKAPLVASDSSSSESDSEEEEEERGQLTQSDCSNERNKDNSKMVEEIENNKAPMDR